LAARTTMAINIVMLQTSVPVLIVVASFILFRETVTLQQALGIAISLVGALILISHGDWHVLAGIDFHVGDLWMLAACVIYAVFTALLRLRPSIHPLSFV